MKHKRFALCINYQDTNVQIERQFDLSFPVCLEPFECV